MLKSFYLYEKKYYELSTYMKEMKELFKLYDKYLKTIKKIRFDPVILFISVNFSHSLKGLITLYLILLLAVHLPIIFYKN